MSCSTSRHAAVDHRRSTGWGWQGSPILFVDFPYWGRGTQKEMSFI